uniref:iron chelate uptake ABC transporter family permease subunit n=1 Tax=Streptomyces caniscabiei TaxID=2746961 RepID=UPI001F02B92A
MNHAQLTALGRALRVLGEHGEALTADTPDARLHEVKADLKRALELLDETVTRAAPTTRCAEHPSGPVDEEAPDRCLLCETRRRAARRTQLNAMAMGDDTARALGADLNRTRALSMAAATVLCGAATAACGPIG